MRDGRIKEYRFVVADITANAAGSFVAYSNHSLNGRLLAIQVQEIVILDMLILEMR